MKWVLGVLVLVMMSSAVSADSSLKDAKYFLNFTGGSLADATGHFSGFSCDIGVGSNGYVGDGLPCDGVNSGESGVSIQTGSSYTTCWWMNQTEPLDPSDPLDVYMINDNSNNGIYIGSFYTDMLYGYVNASEYHFGNASDVVSIGGWQHWCVVYDPGICVYTLYRNATNVSTFQSCHDIPDGDSVSFYGKFSGSFPAEIPIGLDEWGVWNRSLTQNELTAIYQAGVNGVSYPFIGYSESNVPPTVPIIFAPVNGSTVFGLVDVLWTVSNDTDPVSYNAYAYFLNGSIAETIIDPTSSTIGQWETDFFPGVADGQYKLQVNATDGTDTVSSEYVYVTVDNTVPPRDLTNAIQSCSDSVYNSALTFAVIITLLFSLTIPYAKKNDILAQTFAVYLILTGLSFILMLVTGCS